MKNTPVIPAFVAFVGLALFSAPVTALAQTDMTTPDASTAAAAPAPVSATPTPAPAKKPKSKEYHGTLTSVDATMITVTTTKRTITMGIAPTTTFLKDGKKATLADFAVGDQVSGSFDADANGVLTAHSLHKKKPKHMKAPTVPTVTTSADQAIPATPAVPAVPAAQ